MRNVIYLLFPLFILSSWISCNSDEDPLDVFREIAHNSLADSEKSTQVDSDWISAGVTAWLLSRRISNYRRCLLRAYSSGRWPQPWHCRRKINPTLKKKDLLGPPEFYSESFRSSFSFLESLFCFFLGRLAPKVPRLILPLLDFISPFPIVFQI